MRAANIQGRAVGAHIRHTQFCVYPVIPSVLAAPYYKLHIPIRDQSDQSDQIPHDPLTEYVRCKKDTEILLSSPLTQLRMFDSPNDIRGPFFRLCKVKYLFRLYCTKHYR